MNAKTAKPPKDADDVILYNQGRTARLNGISKDEAPHDSASDEHKHWLKGWESVGD